MRVESGRKRGEGVKSYPKKWGKLFERYLDEYLPERKDEICARADREYRKLLPHLCRTDHVLAEVLHARLIRTQTEILGGTYCDYWYVGDRFVTGDGPNVI